MSAERTLAPGAAGRPRLRAEVVDHFRRIRFTDALALECLDRGYRATTIVHLVARAKTSRNTFYELFESKEAVFLALLERAIDELEGRVDRACAGAGDAPSRIEAGLGAALDWAAAEPAVANAVIVEPPTVSDRAIATQAEAVTGFAERLRRCAPAGQARSPLLEELLIGAVTATLCRRIVSGDARSLPTLRPELAALLAAPLRLD